MIDRKLSFLFKGIAASTLLLFFSVLMLSDLFRVQDTLAVELGLPEPNQVLLSSEAYVKPIMKGIKFNPSDPLNLEFVFDSGTGDQISKEEAKVLIKYFLAGLAIEDNDLWVNLSPYESDRVVSDSLGQTDMGRDILAQDYILKQLSASLTDPDTQLGEAYWSVENGESKIENRSNFNKIWISPESAKMFEDGTAAYVIESKFKVESEKDYLAIDENKLDSNKAQGVEQDIISKIYQEVNQDKNFANLRQIYNVLLLSNWFKQKFQNTFYKDYFNSNKIDGIKIDDPSAKTKIWQLYTESFKKGVYNKIKKTKTQKQRYLSGGVVVKSLNQTTDLLPNTQETKNEYKATYNGTPISCSAILADNVSANSENKSNKQGAVSNVIDNEVVQKILEATAYGSGLVVVGVEDRFSGDYEGAKLVDVIGELKERFPEGINKEHCQRAAAYSRMIAQQMGLSQNAIDLIERVEEIHDIGGVNSNISDAGKIRDKNTALINDFSGFSTKGTKKEMLRQIDDYFEINPDTPRDLIINNNDRFYITMANIVAWEYYNKTGKHLSQKELYELYPEFGHEHNSAGILDSNNIKLSEAERFLLINHSYPYEGDMSNLDSIASTEGISKEELMILHNISIAADVIENGTNKERLVNLRKHPTGIQPVKLSFKFMDKVKDQDVIHALKNVLLSNSKAEELITQAREGQGLVDEEKTWLLKELSASSSIKAQDHIGGVSLREISFAVEPYHGHVAKHDISAGLAVFSVSDLIERGPMFN